MRYTSVIIFLCLVSSCLSVSVWRKIGKEEPSFELKLSNNNQARSSRKLNGSITVNYYDEEFKDKTVKVLSGLFSDTRLFTNRQARGRNFMRGRQIVISKKNPFIMILVDIMSKFT